MNTLVDLVENLERGEVIQVDPVYAAGHFGGMFVVVTQVFEYGVQGYVVPFMGEPMLVRVPFGKFRQTGGRVQWDLWEAE